MIISGSLYGKARRSSPSAASFPYEAKTLDSVREHQAGLFEAPRCPRRARRPPSATATAKASRHRPGAAQTGIAAIRRCCRSDPWLKSIADSVTTGSTPSWTPGPVQGRQVDVYMWSCNEALQFGRRPIRLTVLRLGWNPRATTPGFMERIFKRAKPAPLPSRPLPAAVPLS